MQKVMTPSPASGNGARVGHLQELEEVERPRLPPQQHDADQQPTSPALVVQNALTAARAASGRWYQ